MNIWDKMVDFALKRSYISFMLASPLNEVKGLISVLLSFISNYDSSIPTGIWPWYSQPDRGCSSFVEIFAFFFLNVMIASQILFARLAASDDTVAYSLFWLLFSSLDCK